MASRDPNGLILEFTRDHPDVAKITRDRRADAHQELKRWLAAVSVKDLGPLEVDISNLSAAAAATHPPGTLMHDGGLWFNDEAFVVSRRRD